MSRRQSHTSAARNRAIVQHRSALQKARARQGTPGSGLTLPCLLLLSREGESNPGWWPPGLAVMASCPFTHHFSAGVSTSVLLAWPRRIERFPAGALPSPCRAQPARALTCVCPLYSCFLPGAGWPLVGLAQAHMRMEGFSRSSS